MKKTVSGIIMLLLIGTFTFALAFKVQNKPASPSTWSVGPSPDEAFKSIQEAIDNTTVKDGDIIEVRWKNSSYYENVTVNKVLTIRSHSFNPPGHYPTVDGGNKKGVVFKVTVAGVEINGFIVCNGKYGILLASSDNIILNNTITSNSYGIWIGSGNNTLRENKMTGNTWNFGVATTGSVDDFIQDIDESNTVDGKPIYYWVNQHDEEIPTDAGYAAIINSTSITARNLSIQRNYQGVLVAYSSSIVVKDFKCTYPSIDLQHGIVFHNVTNSIIQNVSFSDVEGGILLSNSEDNLVQSNRMTMYYHGLGYIDLTQSNNNVVVDNTVRNDYGLHTGTGISLFASFNNSIIANNIFKTIWGIALQDSNGNIFFHNNFLDTLGQTLINSPDNGFDNGLEGNCWSDYEERYPNATEIDDSGIWNTPYVIQTDIQDNCPLVQPWSAYRVFNRPMEIEPNPTSTQKLSTFSNSTLGTLGSFNFNWTLKQITLKATSGYSGFLNITIPRDWIDGPFTVWIDEGQIESPNIQANATHSSIYITYNNGTHNVKIEGAKRGNIKGDLNGDGVVNILDAITLSANYGSKEPTP